MKNYIIGLVVILLLGLGSAVKAQAPQQFNYQGALRKADGTPLGNQVIAIRLSILEDSALGNSVYSETRQVTTNQFGLYVVAIGSPGASISTNNFSSIAWGSGLKYLKVEVDVAGGTNFVTAGASQLLSVPYAIYAASSGSSNGGGESGKSAYQIWLDAGNTGTEADFLTAITGANGKSAYQIWLDAGNTGTEADFLATITGVNGKSAYQIWLDNGNTGTEADFLATITGVNGKSAYQIWLDNGNIGTETDFLNSLKGTLTPASGDVSGTYPNLTVVKINGVEINSTPPSSGQYLRFDGTRWSPANILASDVAGLDVTTNTGDVISINNGSGAALKAMTVDLKAGPNNTILTTDATGSAKWQSASDANLVTGKLYTTPPVSIIIPANDVAEFTTSVAGLTNGSTIYIVSEGINTDFSILSTTFDGSSNNLKIVFANYQPVDYTIPGMTFKILAVK